MKRRITDYLVYRFRYILGYSFITLLIASVIFGAGLLIPGGLRPAEMESAVISASLTPKEFDPSMVVDLPYHALQRLSMKLFGVTQLGIKAPSMLLAMLTAIGLVVLFHNWFRRNAAIIAIIITVSLPGFMFAAQDGTSLIYYSAISIWMLVASTFVLWHRSPLLLWKCLAFGLAALSLYTPLGVYLILALIIMTFIHPHARFMVRRSSYLKYSAALGVFAVAISPLIYASIQDRHILLRLLGVPEHIDWMASLQAAGTNMFGFWLPATGEIIWPLYPLGFTVLMLIGIFRLFQVRHTVRSYLTWAWTLMMIPLIIINPQYAPLTLIVASLFAVRGIAYLILHWYSMFPRNPYARVAGLLPLALLVLSIGFSNINRYVYGYAYTPDVASSFSRDLALLNAEINRLDGAPATLVVTDEERDFYTTVAKYYPNIEVSIDMPPHMKHETFVSHDAYHASSLQPSAPLAGENIEVTQGMPERILTSSRSSDADRFYIYKSTDK